MADEIYACININNFYAIIVINFEYSDINHEKNLLKDLI